MNYFDGMRDYVSIADALKKGFNDQKNSNLRSTYFKITAHKKGTIHLTFLNDDVLRRFNVAACKGKKWLPPDYGQKKYNELNESEKNVVNSFDGQKQYDANAGKHLFISVVNEKLLTT